MFKIVLVEPEDNANIGAVARAMKNTGFHQLTLVSPRRYDAARASITACWAADLLENLTLAEDLGQALAQQEDVIGFSAREGKNRPLLSLEDWLRRLKGSPARRTALLFGPEDTGLRNEHIQHCRWLVRIPSSVDCPSYNLAQAVLIVLYELSKDEILSDFRRENAENNVPWDQYKSLEMLVRETLTASGFYGPETPPHIPDLINNLFRRILPSEREMRVLQGVFGSILKKMR